jgi:hypothetical protein
VTIVRTITPDFASVLAIVEACRHQIEAASGPSGHIAFQAFPHGACGDTSDLLVRFLIERHGYDAKVAVGTKGQHQTHAWVVVEDLIIDITADQFDGQPPVIVTDESPWHAAWASSLRPHTGPDNWPMYPHAIWQALVGSRA